MLKHIQWRHTLVSKSEHHKLRSSFLSGSWQMKIYRFCYTVLISRWDTSYGKQMELSLFVLVLLSLLNSMFLSYFIIFNQKQTQSVCMLDQEYIYYTVPRLDFVCCKYEYYMNCVVCTDLYGPFKSEYRYLIRSRIRYTTNETNTCKTRCFFYE